MARLLFVCSGNTCRSPLAAVHARSIVGERGVPVTVASAGISAVDGGPASGHAQTVAVMEGGSLEGHRSSQIDAGLLAAADLILTMTAAHRDSLHRQWPQDRDRVMTLGEASGLNVDVGDPFGGTIEDYERTSREIGRLVRAAWPTIERELGI